MNCGRDPRPWTTQFVRFGHFVTGRPTRRPPAKMGRDRGKKRESLGPTPFRARLCRIGPSGTGQPGPKCTGPVRTGLTYHGVIMITNQRFLFSPGILGTHNRDPAKDPQIPVCDQTDILAENFQKKSSFSHMKQRSGLRCGVLSCAALSLAVDNIYIYVYSFSCISAVRSLWPSTRVSCFFCFA